MGVIGGDDDDGDGCELLEALRVCADVMNLDDDDGGRCDVM